MGTVWEGKHCIKYEVSILLCKPTESHHTLYDSLSDDFQFRTICWNASANKMSNNLSLGNNREMDWDKVPKNK